MGTTSSTRRATAVGAVGAGRGATGRTEVDGRSGSPSSRRGGRRADGRREPGRGAGDGGAGDGAAGDGGAVPANVVVLCGRLSSDPQWRELASGSVLWSLEVTTQGENGAASVPVAWFDPPAEPTVVAGDEVYVVGEVRRRFFRGANGTQSRTEVVATEVWRTSQRAKVRASAERLADVMGRAGGRGLRSP